MSDAPTKLSIRKSRMFLGSMDDSVARYPFERRSFDLAAINRLLIYMALIGLPLCVRGGNLIYTDQLFQCLLEPDRSPIYALSRAGFLQIQMKGDGFNHSIEQRLEIRTNSTFEFRENHGWEASPKNTVFSRLAALDTDLSKGKGWIKYSPDFAEIFKRLCDNLDVPKGIPFETVFSRWRQTLPRLKQSRSEFEELGKTMLATGELKHYGELAHAMHRINAINHYAYALGMEREHGAGAMETLELPVFQDLTLSPFGQEERMKDIELLKELRADSVLSILEDHLQIPDDIFEDPALWTRLADFLDPDRGSKHNFAQAYKGRLLEEIVGILEPKGTVQEAKSNLRTAAIEYSKFLNDALDTRERSKTSLRLELFARRAGPQMLSAKGGWAAGAALTPEGAAATIAVNLVAGVATSKLGQVITRSIDQFRLPKQAAMEIEWDDRMLVYTGLALREIDPGASGRVMPSVPGE